jgi:hypothetical protein
MTNYGYATEIVPATNGFIIKVGCTCFVKEGTIDDVAPLLTRYFKCDETLAKEFGRNPSNAFFNYSGGATPCENPFGARERNWETPANSWLNSKLSPENISRAGFIMSKTILKAANGTITINHETEDITVEETSV